MRPDRRRSRRGRRGPALVALLVVVPIAAGCSPDGDEPGDTSGSSSSSSSGPTAGTTPVTALPAVAVDWAVRNVTADLGGGFSARHCEGDAPILCIDQDGRTVGIVEAFDFPPERGTTIRSRVRDLYASTTEDRQTGCPAGYQVVTNEVVDTTVAGTPGVRYGFTGVFADGRPSEATIGYMTEQGGRVRVVVAAAAEPDGCLPPEGPSFTVELLGRFAPHLEALVVGSTLG